MDQRPLSMALRLMYFSSSFVFAILITIGLSVACLGALSNSALNKIDVGGLVVGMLLVCALLVAGCWLAYLPLRRHPRLVRAAASAFGLAVVISLVLIVLIDWG
ncbi:hypothetical protein FHW16_003769 [Phyllobacterium myrsinacearum]|uniref:Uncharacterized protein n=1 Tax=Phyllobacterium myrsinacearum TaxID=28101 RepID=A0A839EU10_9HYPH|nr:hypothetical protein [Phyllobacterium myrsinacearum]